MTRINIGIHPSQLTDEHLRAEYREIQRLPSYYRKAVASGSINRIPDKPTLGKGHVLWCLGYWTFMNTQLLNIRIEMRSRGFQTSSTEEFDVFLKSAQIKHYNDYTPTPEDTEMLKTRIIERITNSPKKYWHYRGERITAEQAIKLLD